MRTNMLIVSALMAILCLVAITTCASVRKDKDAGAAGEGLVLTNLWKKYSAARKADLPKEMSDVLDTIISKAKAGRLHYDFYTAASRKVEVMAGRDWKRRGEYEAWLDKEVSEYSEPIVTFHHRHSEEGAESLTDYVLVNKSRLQAARNGAFYGDGLDDLWTGMVKDDYEYTLWILSVIGHSEKAMSLLNDYLGGDYPKAAYLEYRQIIDRGYPYDGKGRAARTAALGSFIDKYEGRAVSLYGKAVVLRDRFDSLSWAKESYSTLEASYKALYNDCRLTEKERLSYKSGVDKSIAGKIEDFKTLMESLDGKEIGIAFEKGVAVLTLRNLDKVSVEFVPDAEGAKPLVRKTMENPRRSFYLQDTLRLELPECNDGKYVFTARNGKVTSKAEWTKNTLSVALRADSEKRRFFVADYLTGKPLEKVDLKLLRSGKVVAEASDVALSDDGFTPLPDVIEKGIKDGAVNFLSVSYRDPEGFLHKAAELYISGGSSGVSGHEDAGRSFCEVFTDKSAYNPGEKVNFKAVLYRGDLSKSLHTFEAGVDVEAELISPEGETVGSTKLATNEYGSVAGSFDIPSGERNGRFQVRVFCDDVDASREITVDEFILPTYDLAFDAIDRLYIAGDTVLVSGKVSSFSGHPLSSAALSYSVRGSGKTVASGPLLPEGDGSFSLRFPTDGNEGRGNLYEVEVKVVDPTGETKAFSTYVLVLNTFNLEAEVRNASDGEINLSAGDRRGTPFMVSGDKAVVFFASEGLNGSKIKSPIEIRYSLKNISGDKIVSGETVSGKTVDFALPEEGIYCLEADAEITREDGREVQVRKQIMILRVDDSATALGFRVKNLFKPVGDCADGLLRDGEKIRVQFGAGEGPVWAVVELFGDRRQLLEHKVVRLDGKVGEPGSLTEIVYEYRKEYPDAVRLMVFYFRDGSRWSFDKEFKRERKSLELPLAFTSFTDKALPGREYSLTLKSGPGVEAVAAVFDKSSEVVSANEWPVVRLSERGADAVYLSVSFGGIRGDMCNDIEVVGYGSPVARVRGLARAKTVRNMSLTADVEDAEPVMMGTASGEEIPEVEVRTDFSLSLAFEPFLRSDADGNIVLKFRTSDKLSTFVAQVWAHTKDMSNACVRKDLIVSVPVKVSVAEPEYLYKGDRFVLHATVSNSSGKAVSGVAALQTYSSKDYEGTRPSASSSKKVTVPAGGSVEVCFNVNPKEFDELGLKVVFADNAKTFSDGVFVSLPVREAKQTLTESHSAVLLAGADKAALVRRLESEFTGTTSKGAEIDEIDIRRMVLDAVPSKVEPEGKDILSLTEALYVRRVAASLGAKIEPEMSEESLVGKIKACLNADGGVGWFEGMRSSPVVTAVVLERLAKMRDAGLDSGGIDPVGPVKWLDRNQFLYGTVVPRWCGRLTMEQYAFVRSMYPSVPFDVSAQTRNEKSEYARNYKEFRKAVKDYLLPSVKDGRGLDGLILAKARRVKTLANLVNGEEGLALASAWGLRFSAASKMNQSLAADVKSLLEYAVRHQDGGWYYPNAVMPWRGLLESEAYAHALICDLLSSPVAEPFEAGAETGVTGGQIADGIRLWLMLQKETQKWDGDPAFVDALNSVLAGSDDILSTKVVSLTKSYTVPFDKVKAAGNGFTIERHFYKEVTGEGGKTGRLEVFPGMKLNVGDKLTAEYRIWNQENRSFVRLTAPREAAFRPVDQLSGAYGWWLRPLSVDAGWTVTPQGYRNVKTDRTEYWFDVYPEEKTTVTEEFFITQEGAFTAPVVTIESLYAPHYRANAAFPGALKTLKQL